jgi:hypothetical protein
MTAKIRLMVYLRCDTTCVEGLGTVSWAKILASAYPAVVGGLVF